LEIIEISQAPININSTSTGDNNSDETSQNISKLEVCGTYQPVKKTLLN
jgi:hypothetical protein